MQRQLKRKEPKTQTCEKYNRKLFFIQSIFLLAIDLALIAPITMMVLQQKNVNYSEIHAIMNKREYGYYRNKSPYSKRACSAQRKYIAQRTVIKRHNQRILQRKYGYKCVYKIYISQDLYAQMIRFARFYKIYCRRNDFIHCIGSRTVHR